MKAHVVDQVIDRVRVVVLTKFFHDISLDVGTSQSSALCIIGFIFYILAQLFSLLGS